MSEPSKYFFVLGVSHTVQGESNFPGTFVDPDYDIVVRDIISSRCIDFVGEEGGDHSTIAESIAQELLGAGHYFNVEPENRWEHGIGETYDGYRLTSVSGGEFDVLRWMVAENEKRERIWVDHLVEKTTSTGLLICGFYHAFSVSAKLLDRGFGVEARTYLPYDKLCSHKS
jgi:hypothetical protein